MHQKEFVFVRILGDKGTTEESKNRTKGGILEDEGRTKGGILG